MRLTVWWSNGPSPGNLGDVLTPVILRGLGYDVARASRRRASLLAIGSIIRFARPHQHVWGSGVIDSKDKTERRARYLAVRGPLTAAIVRRQKGKCPDVFGDPALLLPRVHNTPIEAVHPLGVVPHYRDLQSVRANAGNLPIISPLSATPLSVVDQIRACRAIVSSSLHGIIVAHAYGIPAGWLASKRLHGDGIKFRDYAASVGVELRPQWTIQDAWEARVLPEPIDPAPLVAALGLVR